VRFLSDDWKEEREFLDNKEYEPVYREEDKLPDLPSSPMESHRIGSTASKVPLEREGRGHPEDRDRTCNVHLVPEDGEKGNESNPDPKGIKMNRTERRAEKFSSKDGLLERLEMVVQTRKEEGCKPTSRMMHIEARMGLPGLTRADVQVMWDSYRQEVERMVECEHLNNGESL